MQKSTRKKKEVIEPEEEPFLFEKIKLDNDYYYLDKENRLWNSSAKIVGYLIEKSSKKYILF
jgi:hypothetical protein